MFEQAEKVTVKIHNGRRERDWVLGILKRRNGKQFDSTPLGEDEIVIQRKPGKELLFAYKPSANGMMPILRAGKEGENFGISGYCEKTGKPLLVSVSKVVKKS